MNERLTIQDLIDLLAAKHSMTKKDAEAFVKEFFLLIEQALENEKNVKIKGLGTFKLVDVDSRESVNVNTGERFQIKGHTKVSFTPDTNLRDTINKPFAHFETVVLNESTVLEDTPMEESDEEEAAVSDVETEMINSEMTGNENAGGDIQGEDIQKEMQPEEPVIEEQPAAEEVAVTEVPETDLNETVQTETEPEPVATEEPEAGELPEVETEPEPESVSEEASEEESIEEPTEEQSEETIIDEQKPETETTKEEEEQTVIAEKEEVTAEQIIAQELHKANMEPVAPKMQPEIEQPKATYTDKDSDKKEKSAIPYLIATIIIVLLLCGGAILFIYYPDLFSSSSDKNVADMPEVTHPVQPETQLSDTIAHKDTVAEAVPVTPKETVQPQPVVKKEPAMEPAKVVKAESKPAQQQPAASAYSDSASYKITGTKTKYTIKEGETLTKVSLRFYGTKAMWPYIVKHNPKVIKNPDNVPYGTTIEIPELAKE